MSVYEKRARVAALKRHRSDPNDPAVLDATRDLSAARAEQYIRNLPPLTPEQTRTLVDIVLDEYVASILRDVPPPPREAVEAVRRVFRPARTAG